MQISNFIISKSTNSILFPSNRSGWINYWRTSLHGEEPNILCPEESDQTEAQLSPDGSSISFVSNTNGTTRLSAINFNEPRIKKELVIPEIGTVSYPSWSPNGDKIAYYFGTPSSPKSSANFFSSPLLFIICFHFFQYSEKWLKS